jgi:hypothetical protein
VSRYSLEVVALGNKVGVRGSVCDQGGDVGGGDVHSWADETQWRSYGTTLGYDAAHASGECFHWAKPTRTGSVVNGSATLPILLVVHPEGDGIGA